MGILISKAEICITIPSELETAKSSHLSAVICLPQWIGILFDSLPSMSRVQDIKVDILSNICYIT